MTTISKRIVLVRDSLTQKDFAEKLGINPNTLRSYECGRSLPNQEVLERVCVQFSVSPSWLLLGKGEMKSKENEAASATGSPQDTVRTDTETTKPRANGEGALTEKIRLLEELLCAKDEVIKAKDEVIKALGAENEAKNAKIRSLESQIDMCGGFVDRESFSSLQRRPPHD
ncbi:MAG: helix-turn-helix domain-containing protein [Desulfovibrionaceae bacterium]|nr:helix-turn-helix domain-containing protein [Desulfovibrionaceae bacterium]